jgi:Protein of unknown function (DUF3099)
MAGDGHEQNEREQDWRGQRDRDQDEQDHDGYGRYGYSYDGSAGPQPTRRDKRLYLALMGVCIGLFVLSWAVLDRYSMTAAIAVSAVALVIPPFAVIIANVASATDRRRP